MANGDSFRRGFAKTFGTGLEIGAKAAQTGIAEKIKKQAEKTEKEVAKTRAQRTFEAIRSQAPQDIAADLANIDVTDIGTDTLNTISKTIAKRIFDPQTELEKRFDIGKLAKSEIDIAKATELGVIPTQPSITQHQPVRQAVTGVAQPDIGTTILQGGPAARQQQIKARGQALAQTKKAQAKDLESARKGARGTQRFLTQFENSQKELQNVFPDFGKLGFGGKVQRFQASVLEKLDKFPETSVLVRESKKVANQTARDIEGGRVTDQDRAVYAEALANTLRTPSDTNVRLASNELLRLSDLGGRINDVIVQFANSDVEIMREIAKQTVNGLFNDQVEQMGLQGIKQQLNTEQGESVVSNAQSELDQINARLVELGGQNG